jgi:tetratricopeptide (TPR) repeat protein
LFVEEGKMDKALADFDLVIKIDPKGTLGWYCRAMARARLSQWDKAVADLTTVLLLDPRHGDGLCARGMILQRSGDWDAALRDFELLVRVAPKRADGFASLSRLRATCPDAKYRDGKKALESGKRACDLTEWKDPIYFEYLALAYAELGEFEEAIKWQQKALDDPAFVKQSGESAKQRLETYSRKLPIRDRPDIQLVKMP